MNVVDLLCFSPLVRVLVLPAAVDAALAAQSPELNHIFRLFNRWVERPRLGQGWIFQMVRA